MKKTSTLFLLCAFFLNGSFLSGQVVFTDLNPDLVLTIELEKFSSVKLDIDGDQIDDLEFLSSNYPSFSLWNLGVQQIDTGNPKVEMLYDPTSAQSPIGDYYVKMLSANDPIGPTSGAYSSNYPQLGDVYNPNLLGQGPKYIGFRIVSGSNYKYGWLSVDLSGAGEMSFVISEFAFENTVTTAINAGSGSLGINDHNLSQLRIDVYPNPSASELNISCREHCNLELLEIYSADGKLVYTEDQPVLPLTIPAQHWKNGSYIIQMHDANGKHQSSWVKY